MVAPRNISLIVVVGETASGKSELTMELAERFNGEIICADSRTVYRGMDIGTAKPSSSDRRKIQHYCLDIAAPDEQFTAADFKKYATAAIEEIYQKGKIPIMVGGSGLYIDAVIYDYEFRKLADAKYRQELQNLSIKQLQVRISNCRIPMPENLYNPRHLIRALETGGQQPVMSPLRENILLLGVQYPRQTLEQRVPGRVTAMMKSGLEGEARSLMQKYGWNIPPMQTIGYQEWRPYFEGQISKEQVGESIVHSTLKYAKRQRTWFKRNKSIHWLTAEDKHLEAVDFVTTYLNK